jgi:hypothetical protein
MVKNHLRVNSDRGFYMFLDLDQIWKGVYGSPVLELESLIYGNTLTLSTPAMITECLSSSQCQAFQRLLRSSPTLVS